VHLCGLRGKVFAANDDAQRLTFVRVLVEGTLGIQGFDRLHRRS
jgi:hypothetical protein